MHWPWIKPANKGRFLTRVAASCRRWIATFGTKGAGRLGAPQITCLVPIFSTLRSREAVQGTWRVISGLAINANGLFASELGERLAAKCGSFALICYLHSDETVKCSLCSQGKVDVAAMAEKFGGGHLNVAGFRLPMEHFAREILQGTR